MRLPHHLPASTLALLLLTACGLETPAQPDPRVTDGVVRAHAGTPQHTTPERAAPSGTSSSAGRALHGTVSGLHGTRSDLHGLVTALGGEVRGDTAFAALPADTLFAFDEDRLAPGAQATLRPLLELVSQTQGPVQLVGHTDNVGDTAYNQALSVRRAQAVSDWLQQAGIEAARLSTAGRGAEAPVAQNRNPDGTDHPEGRALNRRVEVQIPVGT